MPRGAGDLVAPGAAAQLLGYYSQFDDQSNNAKLSIKTVLLKIDDTLEKPVLIVLCQDGKYESVNAFGEFCGDVKDDSTLPTWFYGEAENVDDLRASRNFSHDEVWIAAALRRTTAFGNIKFSFKNNQESYISIVSSDPAIELHWPANLACQPNVMNRCISEISKQLERHKSAVRTSTDEPFVIDLVPIADQVEEEMAAAQVRRQQQMGVGGGGFF